MILVTGGAGYIGRHTVAALEAAGFRTLVFDNFSSGHREFVEGVEFFEGDIERIGDIRKAFQAHPIEGVLHFAGRALVAESGKRPELYYETNVGGGVNLLRAMTEAGVRPLVFSSTCATYGIPETDTLDEQHPQAPINPYGETKLAFEKAMGWFAQAHGLKYLALRYFNAAGADPSGSWGEDHDPETHLIPLVLEAAAGLREGASILGTDYPTPDGTCIRDYIHVVDLATAHVQALSGLLDGSVSSEALNLGTGTGSSVREVIDVVREVTGRPFNVVEGPRREGDPPRLVANPSRAREILQWTPASSDLPTIVESAWNWMRKRKGL